MRILVLNQYFHPDLSATGQLLTELCEDLAEHHDVYVVTGRPSYDPAYPVRSKGLVSRDWHGRVRVARVWSTTFDRSIGVAGRLANYATYLASSVLGALRVPRPDVVIALTDPPMVGVIGAAAARAHDAPLVLVMKDVFPETAVALGRLRARPVIAGLRRIVGLLYRHAARVVVIGEDMRRRVAELGVPPERIATIHDWADGTVVRPLTGPSVLRAEEGWDERFVVMHSGNVGLAQDLPTLIDAAQLLEDDPEILIVIVGEGAMKRRLRSEVARRRIGNVRFLPYQPKAILADSLGAADIHVVGLEPGLAGYIVPSKVYGILAAGKPYVAALEEEAEPARIARDHGCGLRVDPRDPQALASAIRDLRQRDLVALGRRARAAFESRFDRDTRTEAYRVLLEEVAASR